RDPAEIARAKHGAIHWQREIDSLLDALTYYCSKLVLETRPHRQVNHLATFQEHLVKLAIAYAAFDRAVQAFQEEFLIGSSKAPAKVRALEPKTREEFVRAYKDMRAREFRVESFFAWLKKNNAFNEIVAQLHANPRQANELDSHLRASTNLAFKDEARLARLARMTIEALRQRVNETGFLEFRV
ncbi:MAG: hypothetical protein J4203_02900, partial [Candidatus Diapherotrites archaeon]|nr:hypothetical protein [Candidatus Diapherotrites archaeon]